MCTRKYEKICEVLEILLKKKTVKENRKNQVDDRKVNSKRCADILCVLLTHT